MHPSQIDALHIPPAPPARSNVVAIKKYAYFGCGWCLSNTQAQLAICEGEKVKCDNCGKSGTMDSSIDLGEVFTKAHNVENWSRRRRHI